MVVLEKIVLSKRARIKSARTLWFHLHDTPEQKNKSIQTIRIGVDWGGRLGGYVRKGRRELLAMVKKGLHLEWGRYCYLLKVINLYSYNV